MRLGERRFALPIAAGAGESPQTLVERLRARDATALRELYQREGKRAFALALRVIGDAAAAEDAVQEAFAQLWERASRIDPEGGRIESLLMTVVHRRAIDHVRRRERGAVQLPDPELLEEIDEQAAAMLERVEDDISLFGLRAELKAALDSLPVEQRLIVDQAYFSHRTLREIAERERLPLGTVKSRLRLAMSKLSESMRSKAPR
jgi:RNA polymerase sigma-70 factor (ECF subfamily)